MCARLAQALIEFWPNNSNNMTIIIFARVHVYVNMCERVCVCVRYQSIIDILKHIFNTILGGRLMRLPQVIIYYHEYSICEGAIQLYW